MGKAMEQAELALGDADFARVKARASRAAGLSLSEAKRMLVVSRLSKIVRGAGFSSFTAYLDHLDSGAGAAEQQGFVNALTTNLTRFFREDHHFEHLVRHVQRLLAAPPRLSADGRPRLRLWSAGCSTGQEAYTMALLLLDALPGLKRCDLRILATDIDTEVLAHARAGLYAASELNGLSAERRRLFETTPEGRVRIPAGARGVVAFKALNLMDSWPLKGPFDAIFCRNVVIYFDRPTQTALFGRMAALLAPGASFYIGHSETLMPHPLGLVPAGRTIYRNEAERGRLAA
jgi:chemotaxis protein methyltransferase CheR